MTDYPYDPELPFVVAATGAAVFPKGILARFKEIDFAKDMEDRFQPGIVEVVDTTPKPKIPEDAEFIHWSDADCNWFAKRTPFGLWEDDCGEERSAAGMLEFIGDAEVVVLNRA